MSSTPGFPAPSTPPSPPSGSSAIPDRWPLKPEFLTDTTLCPACFSEIAIASLPTALDGSLGPVCPACGLDLSVPGALALLDAGRAVVFAESQRRELLARMRRAQAEREQIVARARAAAAPVPAYQPQASVVPQPLPVAQPVNVEGSYTPAQTYPAGSVPGHMVPQPPHPPTARHPGGFAKPRRSGIQVLMLTVGVILVSVMALFFVLLAYSVASLEVRSLLTGAASVVVFGIAVLLQRRRLQGTAEGIAALAVVLFLLDLWIIRANGVFGSGGIDGWLYIGLSVGAVTALLALAARTIPIRTLSLSAVLLAPIAAFALVQGALVGVDASTRAWTALTAVGLGSLVWTRIARPLERMILRVGGMLATVAAAFTAFGAFPDLAAGGSIAFTVLAGVWLGTLAATPSSPSTSGRDAAAPVRLDAWNVLAAIGLGLAASGAGVCLFLWGRVEDAVVWLPATVTALAALVVASLSRIQGLARLVPALRLASVLPLGIAGLAAAPAFAFSVATSAWGATTIPFSVAGFGTPTNPLVQMGMEPPLALLLVAAIAFATVAMLGRTRRWSWIPAGVGGLGLVAGSASIGQPVASAVCLGFLAAALLASVVVLEQTSLRVAFGCVFAAAVFVFGTIGLTSTATFPVTAIASVVLLVAARQVIVRATTAPAVVALAPVATGSAAVALVLSARTVPAWFESVTGATAGAGAPALWMAVAALILGAAIPFSVDLLARPEAAVLAAVAAVAAGSGVAELFTVSSPVLLLVVLGTAAVAGMAWQLHPKVSEWPERSVAAAVVPLSIVGAVDSAWRDFGPTIPSGAAPDDTTGVILAATVVILAAIAPGVFRWRDGRRGSSPARFAWDGALAVAAVLLLVSVAIRPELGWLTLVLLAVAAVLVASGDGDIVGHSRRRHLAWLGLPLAVAGLWLGLARADATVVELYTLPVAGLLLAILGVTLVRRPVSGGTVLPGRSALLAAALAVGLGPSAVVAVGAEPLRAGAVLGISAILVVAGALSPLLFRGLRLAALLWLAGMPGAILVGAGRAILNPDGDSIPFEYWSSSAAIILLAAGLLWHDRRQAPAVFATAAVVSSVLVLSLPTLSALVISEVDAWRGLLVLAVVCGFVVAASVRDEFSPALRWVSAACAVVLAGALLATGTADPFELATVPLAVALIVGGSVRLSRDPSRGSWAELGPGLIVLLVPSLLANFDFSNELWRVVALGVVALLVLGAGLALKLQAPTLIGAVVVVAHGLAQLWPWISGLYGEVPWWLWAGLGGVIIIVWATTLERRIRDLKAVARGISSLR
ncbi:SCO7613 C-terminal domain-containing membrane protein [Mycetocola sp.]|uniref:SCO7613 C-terminal domain-containing membrane protein n=1 Tax=Mycetocola sp. TaxID=1871042 RepID=UPI003988F922